ncbi:hypothetical protein TEA_019553 [Camellia sinensis var. sinensis]|uniref:Uncharacterized protein n=1 Tax=Camellia sinensis var. sinensis TaxID=542762 RepID=A0A4S4F231_CAMSN|nr:hypothetical protein TEA_019553 [Camellia sinensis var. sinensis]
MKSVFTPGLQPPHLERIMIRDCNKIEKIFDSVRTTLSELERLWLSCSLSELESFCKGMETSFFINNYDVPVILTKLKKLQLDSLSKLESICEGIMVCDSIEEIYVRHYPSLKRLPLFLPNDNGQPLAPISVDSEIIDVVAIRQPWRISNGDCGGTCKVSKDVCW